MSENSKKIATIGYDATLQDDLRQLSKSLGMTQGQFLESCIRFFGRTGIDPNSHLDDTRSQIKELRTTFVSFQRNHEKEFRDRFTVLEHQLAEQRNHLAHLYQSMSSVIEKSERTNQSLNAIMIQLNQL